MSKAMFMMGILIFSGGLFGMFLNRKLSKKFMVFMGAVYLAAGACAFFLVEHNFQMPKSDVEIILSDFDEQAESVFLSQVQIDGKEYNLGYMKSGNWVWQNESFGWKNASGTVLEEIDTDVIVEIPIGHVRILSFKADADVGKIQIKENGDTTEQVLHSGENKIQIKATSRKQVYGAKIFKIAIFIILFAIFIIIIQLTEKYWANISGFCRKNGFYLMLLMVAFLSFFFMWRYAEDESFWYDEIYTLGFLKGTEQPNSMWIVNSVMRAWISVAPYGQKYILLLEILAVVCSVYVIGLTGKRVCNERCGIIASILVGFSAIIWGYAAFEFRSYAFLLFFSIVTFYLLLIRNVVVQHKYLFCILYGVSLLLLMDSHEYGKVLALCYLVIDIVLLIGKKINASYLLTWILPFLYGAYWILNNRVGQLWNHYSWTENPTIEIVTNTFMLLCNRQWVLFGLFLCGVVYIMKLFIDYLKGVKAFGQVDKYLYLLYLIVGVFACSIVYSNYVNPDNSLYVSRYFISVIAYIYMIIAVAISKMIDYTVKADTRYSGRHLVMVCVAVLLISNGWQIYRTNPKMHYEDYRGCAEWIKNQEDIYDKDVAIVYTDYDRTTAMGYNEVKLKNYYLNGWLYYFNQGKDKHLPQIISDNKLEDLQDLPYKKIYVISLHFGIKELPKYIDNNTYKSVRDKEEYGLKIYKKINKKASK